MGADPRAASDPTPDLREQAVEAVHRLLDPGCPCPPVSIRPKQRDHDLVALVWPLAERAALDRAERALRDDVRRRNKQRTRLRDDDVTDGVDAAADLVASLQDGETGG